MPAEYTVRALTGEDAASWAALRFDALVQHPLLFGATAPAEHSTLVDFAQTRMSGDESRIFGGFASEQLIGIVGVFRERGPKERHKAFLWGMYVIPSHRSIGVGGTLLNSAITQAREWSGVEQLHLGVSAAPGNAQSLYESRGFVAWGREPRALCWQGEYADEIHMYLDLRTGGSGGTGRSRDALSSV
jgi:GNAT superfamily N-acetyltransferase